MSYEELRLRLPPLPPAMMQRRIEVTGRTFIAWDFMKPWGITAVALLRDDDGGFTVWTPGYLNDWVWRGPRHISKESAELLAMWLSQGQAAVAVETTRRVEANTEVSRETIWIWDPDIELEGGFGVRRLADGGFELSFIMGGLRRGGAYMGSADGHLLAQWLIQVHN